MLSDFRGVVLRLVSWVIVAGLLVGGFGISEAAIAADGSPASASNLNGSNSGNPSLESMNAAGNHSMGSTITAVGSTTQPFTLRSPSVAPSTSSAPGVPGLDVSAWQSNIDWSQVWANGARFAYVKATEGVSYVSGQFAQQFNGSAAVGMIRGAYHFATPNKTSGASQASYFADHGGGWTPDGKTLPPLLDIEYNPYSATDQTDTCYGLTPVQMVAWIGDFSNTMVSRTGRLPAIYTTTNWWALCTGNTSIFAKNPLFLARYPNDIASGAGLLPAGWTSYTFWQYANSGVFPGDQDVFNGGLTELRALAVGTAVPMNFPVAGVGDVNGDGKPDLVARRSDGTLGVYPGHGSGVGYAGIQISDRWAAYDEVIGAGDVNGDGKADLLGRKSDGTLWLFAGTGSVGGADSGFSPAVQIDFGWQVFTDIVAAGDVNGDGKPDLIGRTSSGLLMLYVGSGLAGSSDRGFRPAGQIGSGWDVYSQVIGIGDLNKNGSNDLVAIRPDGSLWYYDGTGTGSYRGGTEISAPGLKSGDLLIAAGDANSDGYPDLFARSPSGLLNLLAGTSSSQTGYDVGQKIGTGWDIFTTVVGTGDANGDGKADLVGVSANGSLWFYAGKGFVGDVSQGFLGGTVIGLSGWNVYSKIINAGDVTGDSKPDLLGVQKDGSLWLYPGVGNSNVYGGGIRIGISGWNVYSRLMAGDFNGDGRPDLIGVRSDGTLWMYPGAAVPSATNPFDPPIEVGTSGWNAFSAVISSNDSNRDQKADLVARTNGGSLLLYKGTGFMSRTDEGYRAPTLVGTGWDMFASVTSSGASASSARSSDVLGITAAGDLFVYPISSSIVSAVSAIVPAGAGWNIFG